MSVYFDENGTEHQKPQEIEPEWRISGYALIRSPDGKILMVQPTWNNKWELPGGRIEIEESIPQGISRECYEETGYKAKVENQPMFVGERNYYSSRIHKFFKSIILVYPASLLDGVQDLAVINSVEKNEIAKAEWVTPNALAESNVHPVAWPAVSKFIMEQKWA